jgi:hypothetical protein
MARCGAPKQMDSQMETVRHNRDTLVIVTQSGSEPCAAIPDFSQDYVRDSFESMAMNIK